MTKDTEALREAVSDLIRPVIGIDCRSAEEVHAIMCDRIKHKFAALTAPSTDPDTIGSHFGNGGEFDPESAVAPVAYRYVHRNYAGQKINIYGDHPVRVNGALPEETHPLYAHPPHPVPVDPVAGWEALRDALVSAACDGIADDYMTSEKHHPGYVLIPSAKFEAILAALKGPAA